MRILHIHTTMQGGGIESMICALANQMALLGHDVTVCSIFKPKREDVFWNKLSDKVKKDTIGKVKTGFSIVEIFKIRNYIKHGTFDIVQVHGYFYYHGLSILTLQKSNHFFYTVHSDAFMENNSREKKVLLLKKMAFRLGFMHAITISPSSQQSFNNLYHCKSTLIPNGIALPIIDNGKNIIDECRITERTKVFIHPGRISTPKNQIVLVKVFDRLIKEGNDVVLVIAGSRQMEDIYSRIEPYFSDRICYIGERDDIPSLMAKADAFCLPSIWEGLPVTLLEALAVGCIPICSPVGGIVDVVKNGINGFLSNSSSENDYYLIVKEFIKFPSDKLLTIRNNCIESFKPYHISRTVDNYIQLYRQYINK